MCLCEIHFNAQLVSSTVSTQTKFKTVSKRETLDASDTINILFSFCIPFVLTHSFFLCEGYFHVTLAFIIIAYV